MPDDSFFESLKQSIEGAKKDQIEVGGHRRQIKRIVVISDDFDDYALRYQLAEQLAARFDAELTKIFLYNIESLLKQKYSMEQFKESPDELIQALKAHSSHIRELKEQKVTILLDKTVKELLTELRKLRQAEEEEFTETEVSALTDFLLGNVDRERNLANSLVEMLKEIKPQIIYFKPPILRARDSITHEGFSYVTEQVLKGKPNGTWVFMRGSKALKEVKKALFLILGGQDLPAIMRAAHAAVSIFPSIKDVELKYLVVIDKKKVNMASLVSETQSLEELKELLRSKMREMVENVKIEDLIPKVDFLFGEIETDLKAKLEEMKPDMVFISPKMTGANIFDEELLNSIIILLQSNLSAFVTY